MKVTCQQNKEKAIRAGVEPTQDGRMVVDVDLSALTQEQRDKLSTPFIYVEVVAGTHAEVAASLQGLLDKDAADAIARDTSLASLENEMRAWAEQVTIEQQGENIECGVAYARYGLSKSRPTCWICPMPERFAFAEQKNVELKGRAEEMTAAAKAAVQPQIDAAWAAATAKEEAEKAEKEKATAASFARRLETGIVEISMERGNRTDWGEPWIAKVT